MPLKLIPPGKRKGNEFYLARGTVGGERVEVSTKTTDRRAAQAFARDLERELAQGRLPASGEPVTFARAAEAYLAWRDPSDVERTRVDRVSGALGHLLVTDITQAHLVEAVEALCIPRRRRKGGPLVPPGPATKNREVLRTAAAILHYAAENRWCAWLRVRMFKEPAPQPRAVSKLTAKVLVRSTDGDVGRLLLWLLCQGDRLSGVLAAQVEHLDLAAGTCLRRVAKSDTWDVVPLAPELLADLRARPPKGKWLFRWRSRSGAAAAIRKAVEPLGIRFTAHMARHSLATWMVEAGADAKTLMKAMGWQNEKMPTRYVEANRDRVASIQSKVGAMWED